MVWYYIVNGVQQGPVSETELRDLARRRVIDGETYVWGEGMPEWVKASTVSQLLIQQTTAPAPLAPATAAIDPFPSIAAADDDDPWTDYQAGAAPQPRSAARTVSTSPYFDNSSRAKVAVFFFYCIIPVIAVMTLMEIGLIFLVGNEQTVFEDITLFDLGLMLLALPAMFQILLILLIAIFFLRWFGKAYENVKAFGGPDLSYSVGSAIWSWFVPFLNLFRPYQIAKEIWERSYTALHGPVASRPADASDDDKTPVTIWWSLLVASGVFSQISSRVADDPFGDPTRLTLSLDAISSLLLISAAVAAIKMIREIQKIQDSALQKIYSESQSPMADVG